MTEKTMKIHSALDAGGGRVVKMATVTSLHWFQAQPIWEMSGKVDAASCRVNTSRAFEIGKMPILLYGCTILACGKACLSLSRPACETWVKLRSSSLSLLNLSNWGTAASLIWSLLSSSASSLTSGARWASPV